MNHTQAGILSIVATPIGNLQDISFRALATLKEADLIAAEDTRHSKHLLSSFNIQKPIWSYHDHNEKKMVKPCIDLLLQGQHIALICDAGTPLIADPGYQLVKSAYSHNIRVQAIPGPSALITALSASGLPSDHFFFLGFLPSKSTAKKQILTDMIHFPHTWISYEASHRIIDTVNMLCNLLEPNRLIVIARELTKHFETIMHGTIQTIAKKMIDDHEQQKGEFVILVQGKKQKSTSEITQNAAKMLTTLVNEGIALKKASSITSKVTGIPSRCIYQYGLQLNKD